MSHPYQKNRKKSPSKPAYSAGLTLLKPDAPNLKEDLLTMDTSTLMQNTHQQTTDTKDLPPMTTHTKRHRRTADQSQSTPISGASAPDVAPQGAVQKPATKLTAGDKKLINDLTGMYASIGALITSGDLYSGVLIIKSAETRATELVMVAKHHKRMYELLKQMTAGNDYVTCALGHGLMLYAILAHFNRVPVNANLLAGFGLSEAQVLAPPEGVTPEMMEAMQNGHAEYAAAAAS